MRFYSSRMSFDELGSGLFVATLDDSREIIDNLPFVIVSAELPLFSRTFGLAIT